MSTLSALKLIVEFNPNLELASFILRPDVPRGILNRGNMCYMNSVLQTIRFIKPLRDKIMAGKGKFTDNLQSVFESMENKTIPPVSKDNVPKPDSIIKELYSGSDDF